MLSSEDGELTADEVEATRDSCTRSGAFVGARKKGLGLTIVSGKLEWPGSGLTKPVLTPLCLTAATRAQQ
jgi:hypothetical protein